MPRAPFLTKIDHQVPSLKVTALAPENRPQAKRKGSSHTHPFFTDKLLFVVSVNTDSFGENQIPFDQIGKN